MTHKEEWYKNCFNNWDARFQKSEGLDVLIARKSPHMVEYEIAEGHLKENPPATLVSEHALPFMLSKEYPVVTVIDDAIYYGTTFENVISWLKTACYFTGKESPTNKNLRADPVVRAKDAKALDHIDLGHVEIIPGKYIPYYIERLTSGFLELGKPFDIEFPILYLTPTEPFDYSPAQVCELLKAVFGKEVYPVVHSGKEGGIAHTNYSVIFSSNLRAGNSNVEFAKFRLFIGKEKICLASYAPSIFPEEILTEESPLFAGTLFEKLWKAAYVPPLQEMAPPSGRAYQDYLLKNYKIEKINQYQWEYQQEEAELFRKRSLMILANYFCSFGLLLENKSRIEQLARQWECTVRGVEKSDLQWLFGPDLAQAFEAVLNRCWSENEAREGGMLPRRLSLPADLLEFMTKDVIPEPYSHTYNAENEQDWRRSHNLSESLSCMFSNMHFHIEKASRGNLPNTFERLRFGVSYDSMYHNLSRKQKHAIDDQMTMLHRWIDKKIDEGSVVPKYDRVQYGDTYYWRRLFRAGENEDKYLGQLARISIFIFDAVCRELKDDYIERDFIENIFALVFSDKFFTGSHMRSLGKIEWKVPPRTATSYQVAFYNEASDTPTYLIDYLLRMQVLKEKDDYTPYLSVMKTTMVNEFRNGTTLDSEREEEIVRYIKILIPLLRENTSFEKMLATMNRIMIEDYAPYEAALKQWQNDKALPFVTYMIDHPAAGIEEYEPYKDIKKEIDTLFEKSYFLTTGEITARYKALPPTVCMKPTGEEQKISLPEDDVPSSIYRKKLYAMYNLSELIEAVCSFGDKEYVAFIVDKMLKAYNQFAKEQWVDFVQNYARYQENKTIFFTKAKHLICYYENINPGSVNENNRVDCRESDSLHRI